MTPETITIAVALILNTNGQMLVVRKRGTTAFMQPGGKLDAGETPLAALQRELREEISLALMDDDFESLGTFSDRAANEPGATVVAHAFATFGNPEITLAAEIEDAHWLDLKAANHIELAHLTRNHMLPLAQELSSQQAGGVK